MTVSFEEQAALAISRLRAEVGDDEGMIAEAMARTLKPFIGKPARPLARTPATTKWGCLGCRDGDNSRRPPHDAQPWRCEPCPIRQVRRRLGLESGAPIWPDGGPGKYCAAEEWIAARVDRLLGAKNAR